MENLDRPTPAQGVTERFQNWVRWVGFGRLVGSATATVVVCAGAFWLVRTPPPPTEASLPRASAVPASDSVPTLPPPVVQSAGQVAAGSPGDGSNNAPTILAVHVAGAVAQPGVYALDAGARVHMAVAAAGGFAPEADPDALNLAAIVVDGQRIYVPLIGEVVAQATPAIAGPVSAPVPAGPIDINRALAAELEALPGVGPATSTAIVLERERNGPFLTVDELDRVPGIGPAKLASIRDLVTV